MYSKQQAAFIRKKFWTSFGQYMRPIKGAGGDTINWLNYKTGIKDIYFRMDAGIAVASIAIELRHTDPTLREHFFNELLRLKNIFEQEAGEEWDWQHDISDEDGNSISRVSRMINGVNILNETEWPTIISFLKPRIIALDRFWGSVKDVLDAL